MIDPSAFSKMVPGLNFLQTWMRGAGQATPGMGQWIAPTLDPAELDKRIGELKTVQFWLEQNSRLISATVQAMEVQRMTLSTLQTMNLPLAELQKAMMLPTGQGVPAPAPSAPKPAPTPQPKEPEATSPGADSPAEAAAAKPAVDPMQWWSALTQQFGELAAKAVQDGQAGISQLAAAAPQAAADQTAGKDGATSRRRKAAAPAKTSAPRRR